MPDPETDVQLTIDGEEIPVEDLPEPEKPETSQIGPDDEWPEDMF